MSRLNLPRVLATLGLLILGGFLAPFFAPNKADAGYRRDQICTGPDCQQNQWQRVELVPYQVVQAAPQQQAPVQNAAENGEGDPPKPVAVNKPQAVASGGCAGFTAGSCSGFTAGQFRTFTTFASGGCSGFTAGSGCQGSTAGSGCAGGTAGVGLLGAHRERAEARRDARYERRHGS